MQQNNNSANSNHINELFFSENMTSRTHISCCYCIKKCSQAKQRNQFLINKDISVVGETSKNKPRAQVEVHSASVKDVSNS